MGTGYTLLLARARKIFGLPLIFDFFDRGANTKQDLDVFVEVFCFVSDIFAYGKSDIRPCGRVIYSLRECDIRAARV